MSKRNAEYWADRLSRQNQRIGDKTVEELETRLRQYYRAASADITKEAEGLYNKLLAEAGDQPVRPNDLYRLDRMYHLQSKIHKRLRELGGQEIETTANKLREVAELVDKNTISGLPDAAKNSPWAVLTVNRRRQSLTGYGVPTGRTGVTGYGRIRRPCSSGLRRAWWTGLSVVSKPTN